MGLVYKAVNKKNGKVYVGGTMSTLERRRLRHLASALNGTEPSPFHADILKYDFSWSVIEYQTDPKKLSIREVYWIKKLGTLAPKGYNRTDVRWDFLKRKFMGPRKKKKR